MLTKLSVRSPWLFRINAGSCNGCDVELATTACIPRYDVERLGCRYCGTLMRPLPLKLAEKLYAKNSEIDPDQIRHLCPKCRQIEDAKRSLCHLPEPHKAMEPAQTPASAAPTTD